MNKQIAFIGAGSMTEAMIKGIRQKGTIESQQITVTNRSNLNRLLQLKNLYSVQTSSSVEDFIKDTNIIFLAMKPKDAKEALQTLRPYVESHQLIISLMAGITTAAIERSFEKEIGVIRAMPNTSASIGFSATSLSKGLFATKDQLAEAVVLFEAIGIVKTIEEKQMDAVTGLIGSGPAYVYFLVEAMQEAAEKLGLEDNLSETFILQTLKGATKMIESSEKTAAQLRDDVTSPYGTTEAAMNILSQHDTKETLVQCILKAAQRSNELQLSMTNNLLNSTQ
ncbi:pyrroline-5-carboxylate reductase [Bacillus carboniphilus]|uniref:Pyrroline-5-carboxylate reductase n=1 Tax=Bacillus carboniphilus TaxID=86663 RepID=A0ABY9K1P8_9BACI|nr:pyrroline-5-carboxylate reductase [Bacillus carboniphilus]WLR43846.1 pyrroline-5-carboxylate reductase [Bacillus carboniphilus]